MTWTRLSDDFADRPDIIGLSNDAFSCHVRALIWCNRQATDGRLPARAVRLLVAVDDDPAAIVDELVHAGIWEPTDDGVFQLDWADQEPAERVMQRKAFSAEKQRRYRDRKARHDAGDHSQCDPRFCPSVTGNEIGNATGHETVDKPRSVTATRPDPTRPVPSEGQGQGQGAEPPPAAAAEHRPAGEETPRSPDHEFAPDGDTRGCVKCGLPQANRRHTRTEVAP